ncbi:PQQ-binding-like beta-propeller repeat protein [Pseudosulfitobacter sp. SM2401]|uniref:outer membrane protein assembly factor BamB family protein n=1 Tax=Pseudosulfitobacter sp. SM2401 TaxID=3350098 RepID=UPI0036F3A3A8
MTMRSKSIRFNTDRSDADARRSVRRPSFLTGAAVVSAIFLGACSEPEVILQGKRETLRSVLQDPAEQINLDEVAANQSRAISLGKTTNNASWTHGTGTQTYRTTHPALGSSLQLAWSANIGAGDSRKHRITADPVSDKGVIYTLDATSTVTATNTSGATAWSKDIRPPRDSKDDATGGGLAVHEGTLYVSLGFGELVAMDAANGAVRWRQQLNATGSGQPTVSGNLVYVLAGDDTGWALDTKTGRIEWQITGAASVSNVLGAPAPVVADDLAIFAFGSGELQAVFRRGGLRRWDASILGERPGRALSNIDDVTGTPVVDGSVLYAGNQAGRIAAINVRSGARLWTARDGAVGPVWPAGDSVFAVTDKNELVRLDANDGSRVWGVQLPNFLKNKPRKTAEIFAHHGPIVAGGRVIVASNDGMLRSFDPRDGSLIASSEIPGGATTAPIVVGSTLYVVGRKGQLHAFR